ncbi:MAG: hypothetical protein ACOYL5_13275 [Phototrophicaceae bacterium]
MFKRLFPVGLLLVAALVAVSVYGQTATPAADTPQTTVQILYVACETEGVINVTGFATPGFDIFFRLYSGSAGSGDALTDLRRANVDGDYAYSERTPYQNGLNAAPGAIASAYIAIANTNTPESPVYETTVDDLVDGCGDAQNALQISDSAGAPVSDTGIDDPSTAFGIASPYGGLYNSGILNPTPLPAVVLGPRLPSLAGRTANPGLIFAQCNAFYPETTPGVIYDSDNAQVYWYWFADSAETVLQNLLYTNYYVKINGAPAVGTYTTPVTQRGNLFYVFYIVPLGNLSEGWYEIEFKQEWTLQINDGFDDYGPGTPNRLVDTGCNFYVTRNPLGGSYTYNNIYTGQANPPHNFERDIVQQQVIRDYLRTQSNIGQGVNVTPTPTTTP